MRLKSDWALMPLKIAILVVAAECNAAMLHRLACFVDCGLSQMSTHPFLAEHSLPELQQGG